jgi:hypothetical protein
VPQRFIVNGARTPIGRYGRAPSGVRPATTCVGIALVLERV